MSSETTYTRPSQGKPLLFRQTLLDHHAQPVRVHPGILPRECLRLLLGLILALPFFVEIRRHHLDHTRDQIFLVSLGLDRTFRNQTLNQMVRERVDLCFADHRSTYSAFDALRVKSKPARSTPRNPRRSGYLSILARCPRRAQRRIRPHRHVGWRRSAVRRDTGGAPL